jgi:hypothetical protein
MFVAFSIEHRFGEPNRAFYEWVQSVQKDYHGIDSEVKLPDIGPNPTLKP